MIYCRDCEKYFTDEDAVFYSLSAFDDDPDMLCPYCGSDHVTECEEEDKDR